MYSYDHSNKVWLQLAKQFQTKRFLNIFLIAIGSYVKTLSADVGGLVWWAESFHQNVVPTGQAVSQEIANIGFWQVGSTDKILKGANITCDLQNVRTITTKLGLNWPNSLREEF